jgi:hypothetical protein
MKKKQFKKGMIRLLIMPILLFYGCIVVPKAVEDREATCELSTRKFTLDVYGSTSPDGQQLAREVNILSASKCDDPACLLVMAPVITVSVGSVIVSGSLTVIGNTIHWLEKEGRCDDGVINQAVTGIRDTAVDAGGWIVETTGDLVGFFTDSFD